MNLMNNPDIVAAIVAVISGIGVAIKVGINKIFNRVDKLLAELKPNGGSSIKDQINRLDHRIDEIYQLLIKGK